MQSEDGECFGDCTILNDQHKQIKSNKLFVSIPFVTLPSQKLELRLTRHSTEDSKLEFESV